MRLTVSRAKRIGGEFRPPSDKSLTHRAYLLAAIARTPSVIAEPLQGEDCESTLNCLRALGVKTETEGASVHLQPPVELRTPTVDLDCGNSGTTARLLAGILASHPIVATFVGDASLSRRPMRRVAEPLGLMGARIEGASLPMTVHGGALKGISYDSPVASAQIKSAVLLAGLRAEGTTTVREPTLSRDHTERMLTALGVPVESGPNGTTVRGGSAFDGFGFLVPGDPSSAAFFLVAAAILPESNVWAKDTLINPTRIGFMEALRAAGAWCTINPTAENLGEGLGELEVSARERLTAFDLGGDLIPRLIDEVPILAVLATQCRGTSTFRDCGELRVKESDRLAKMADGLRRMGARIEETPDGLIIDGPTPLTGTPIDASGDHRIAMSFAIAGLVADGETIIDGAESIATSFPGFRSELHRLCER